MSNLDNCFSCGIEFTPSLWDGGPKDHPGIIFEATGNWGSTIFDPSPKERPAMLVIRICDKCVLNKLSRVQEIGDQLQKELRKDVKEFFDKY